MRKCFAALLFGMITSAPRATDRFKDFYQLPQQERFVAAKMLPGDAVLIVSRVAEADPDISRILFQSGGPPLALKAPAGLRFVAAARDAGVLLEDEDGVYIYHAETRAVEHPANWLKVETVSTTFNGLKFTVRTRNGELSKMTLDREGLVEGERTHTVKGKDGKTYSFSIGSLGVTSDQPAACVISDKGHLELPLPGQRPSRIEKASPEKKILGWACKELIGWVAVELRDKQGAPRRTVRVFLMDDRSTLSEAELDSTVDIKDEIVEIRPLNLLSAGLIIKSPRGIEWWSFKCEKIANWTEENIDLASARKHGAQ